MLVHKFDPITCKLYLVEMSRSAARLLKPLAAVAMLSCIRTDIPPADAHPPAPPPVVYHGTPPAFPPAWGSAGGGYYIPSPTPLPSAQVWRTASPSGDSGDAWGEGLGRVNLTGHVDAPECDTPPPDATSRVDAPGGTMIFICAAVFLFIWRALKYEGGTIRC